MYGDVTRYTVEVSDHTDASPFFWATIYDELGNVVASDEGKFPEDALANAAIRANNREFARRQQEG